MRIFEGKLPEHLGVTNGRLSECPKKPNCVCSQTKEPSHYTQPLEFSVEATEAIAKLKDALESLGNIEIITESAGYVHAICRSKLLGYIDDIEFLLDAEQKVFHVRSASRLGFSDFGVNRKRVKKLRINLSSG